MWGEFAWPVGVSQGHPRGQPGAGEPQRCRAGEAFGARPGPGETREERRGSHRAGPAPGPGPTIAPGLRPAGPALPSAGFPRDTAALSKAGPAPRGAAHHRSRLSCPSPLPLPEAQGEKNAPPSTCATPPQHILFTRNHSGHCTLYTDILPLQQGRSCARLVASSGAYPTVHGKCPPRLEVSAVRVQVTFPVLLSLLR